MSYENKINLELEITNLQRVKKSLVEEVTIKKWEYAQIKSLLDDTKENLDAINTKSKEAIAKVSDEKLKATQDIANQQAKIDAKKKEVDEIIKKGKELVDKEQKLNQKQQDIDAKIAENKALEAQNKADLRALDSYKKELEDMKIALKNKELALEKDYNDKLTKAKKAFIENL